MTAGFIPKHGGYQDLLSYRKSQIVYDATVRFVERFLKKGDRTVDQMVQAARSGKQNIVEGSMASGTSKETEIKLMNVARASLEELLRDHREYPRVPDPPDQLPAGPADPATGTGLPERGRTARTHDPRPDRRPQPCDVNRLAICPKKLHDFGQMNPIFMADCYAK